MIKCPHCGEENDQQALRCIGCDEWLVFYEFENETPVEKPKKEKKHDKKVFLPDNLIDKNSDAVADENLEKLMRYGTGYTDSEMVTPDDPAVIAAFSSECPNCGGDIKQYEVRCRHCNTVLTDKIEQGKRLKPYYEKMFRDQVLKDGNYDDIYTTSDVKFLFKRIMKKENKMLMYVVFSLLMVIVLGGMLMVCSRTMSMM
ncbi:MAG: hypothetical protein JW737_02635 [Acidobacteria bacterium]|nr:hypothetical protein [Acidobacteriota bacterium]